MFKLMIVFLFVCNSIFGSIPMSVQTPPSLKTNLGAYLDKIVQLPMMNIKGNALFDFRIDKNGKVNDVRVIELPFGVFEKDVIESINELEFIPAKINGEPIEVRYRMPIHFKG